MAAPLHTHYTFKPTGEVFPALKHPSGYEDAHPEDWEPTTAPEAKGPAVTAPLTPPIPNIPNIPPLAPQLPPNTEQTVLEGKSLDPEHDEHSDNG